MALLVTIGCGDEHPGREATGPPRPTTLDPVFHTSPRFVARVVDATTGEPVSGAVVLVIWRLIERPAGRWYYGGMFRIEELRTDTDGRFEVQRWGPRRATHRTCLDRRDPELWVLRRGYLLGYFDNVGKLDARYFAAEQTLPPGKLPPYRLNDREGFCRVTAQTPTWSGKSLPLVRATSAIELRRSLTVANPIDPLDLSPPRLPEFWKEWRDSAAELPPGVSRDLPVPAPLARAEEDAAARRQAGFPD